ncbi:MAG: hypothetical protein K9G41_06330 [Flavobacteriales bacterium]|nr:hypothetical protein [Flavobacteriales bacterium]
MKMLTAFLLSTLAMAYFSNEPIPKHNVYFAWNEPEIKSTSRQVIEAIYAKTPAGTKVRFGIEGPISSAHNTADKNRITSERANNIVDLLKQLGSDKDHIEIIDVTDPYLTKPSELTSSKPFQLEVLLSKAQGWVSPAFTSIDEFLPLPVQTFNINPREDNRLVGAQGTIINIPAFTLELKNGTVPSTMIVELKEVYGGGTIVQANLHTASGGKMLRSGGTIHIDANTNGKPAMVASGKHLDLEFPHGDEVAENMEVFNGRVDRSGNFDWVPKAGIVQLESRVREEFYINDVKVSKEEYLARMQAWEDRKAERERQEAEWAKEQEISNEVAANAESMDAYLLKSDQLGWINCDEFYDVENKTDVIVYVDTTYRPSVRMVFDNISSVMGGDYNHRTGTVTFRDVPVGESVRLVGYSIMDGKAYMDNRNVIVSEKLKHDLKLAATTKQQMESELASLN